MPKLRIPRLSTVDILRRLSLAYLIVWVLSPPLAYGELWRVLAMAAMGLWLALELRASRSVLLRPNLPVFLSVAYVAYSLGVELLVPDSSDINHHFQIWIMLFFLVVGESLQRGRRDEAVFCFFTILLVLPIWSFTTLRGIASISADVARTISRSSIEARELTSQGIGGFGFVYTTVLCLPFLAQLALRPLTNMPATRGRRTQRAVRLLLWCNFVLAVLLVLRAGYSIALILSGIALTFVLLVRSRRGVPLAISLTFVALVVVTASVALPRALDALRAAATGTEYARKVQDVSDSLERDESVGTFADRTERYGRSLEMFIAYPVTGTLTTYGIGGHSSILDRYGQYGFLVGTLFLWLLVRVPWRSVRNPRIPIGLGLAFLFVAVAFPLLNPVFMAWGLVLYVFSHGAFIVIGEQDGHAVNSGAVPYHAHEGVRAAARWIPR